MLPQSLFIFCFFNLLLVLVLAICRGVVYLAHIPLARRRVGSALDDQWLRRSSAAAEREGVKKGKQAEPQEMMSFRAAFSRQLPVAIASPSSLASQKRLRKKRPT